MIFQVYCNLLTEQQNPHILILLNPTIHYGESFYGSFNGKISWKVWKVSIGLLF